MSFALRALQELAPLLTFSWTEGEKNGWEETTSGRKLLHVRADPRGSGLVREIMTDESAVFRTLVNETWTEEPGCVEANDLVVRLMRRHLLGALDADAEERKAHLSMVFAASPAQFSAKSSAFLRKPVEVSESAFAPLWAIMALPSQPQIAR